MKIVSNTGPLIGLAKIAQISLLKSMAEEVLIPPAVHRELLGKFGPESEEIDRALRDFISVRQLKPLESEAEVALVDLDEGERQAIGLASTLGEDVLLLLDDQAGGKWLQKVACPVKYLFHGACPLFLNAAIAARLTLPGYQG